MSGHPLARQFRLQAGFSLPGSPLYATLFEQVADDLDRGGVSTRVVAGHEDERPATALPLRLIGAVHRLALAGELPELARFYPSMGGTGPVGEAWPALAAVLASRCDDLRALLDQPLQTNETGRAVLLFGALLMVAERTGLPIRLLELGASAGLNLLVDRFRYDVAVDGGQLVTLGDPASPLRFVRPWEGLPPASLETRVSITERHGCDPRPIDAGDPDGRLTLTSYVWADDVVRLDRLRAALKVAAADPPRVERAGGAGWLADRLSTPRPGVVTVVWHSVVWQYVDQTERAGILGALSNAAARATSSAPMAYLRFEPRTAPPRYSGFFELQASIWPAGPVDQAIATGAGHGIPARWSQ
jgi:hypothetical protein